MTAKNPKRKKPGRKAGSPLSERELQQRKDAAANSTGPRTELGKAASSRNAWKHGMSSAVARNAFAVTAADSIAALFGKPCTTRCPMHPDNPEVEHPCSLVLDGLTRAGRSCLDKTVYMNSLMALTDAMENGQLQGTHQMLAAEGAKVMQMLHQITEEIARNGLLVKVPLITKEGKVVKDESGAVIAADYKLNPLVPAWQKIMSDFGISLPEMLATPQAKAKSKTAETASDAFQTLLGGIMQRAGQPKPTALPAPADD